MQVATLHRADSDRIRRTRRWARITQTELAAMMGTTVAAVRRWERAGNIHEDELARLSDLFGVSTGFLLGEPLFT